jgi:hypothetical protein
MFAVAILGALLLWRSHPWMLASVATAMAISSVAATSLAYDRNTLLPDGRLGKRNNLAYIDASHLESYSREGWRENGTGGFCLTLMRGGYLPLTLPEVTPQRLDRAALLVSIGPRREFSQFERETIKAFVDRGGVFICTVGFPESGPSRKLLEEFDFHVGQRRELLNKPGREPEPGSHFKAEFFEGKDYKNFGRFDAGWQVLGFGDAQMVIAERPPRWAGMGLKPEPIVVLRRYGEGIVVVVGDTGFAMNKNLEHKGGEPFEGMRENAHFWRWFLPFLFANPDEPLPWFPPDPKDDLKQNAEDSLLPEDDLPDDPPPAPPLSPGNAPGNAPGDAADRGINTRGVAPPGANLLPPEPTATNDPKNGDDARREVDGAHDDPAGVSPGDAPDDAPADAVRPPGGAS